MGYTGSVIVARPTCAADDARAALRATGFADVTSLPEGWIHAESTDRSVIVHEGLAAELAEQLAGPVLIGDVTHSDFAWLVVAAPSIAAVSLLLTPAALRREGVPVPSTAEQEAAMEAIASWSRAAIKPLTIEYLRSNVRRRMTFAEDHLWEIIDTLGLGPALETPAAVLAARDPTAPTFWDGLDGYLAPLEWMNDDGFWCVDRHVPWAEYRYVPGLGDGFIGIWDRESPAHPIRFDHSHKGMDQMFKRLEKLGWPLERKLTDTEALVGLVRPLPSDDFQLRPAGRALPIRISRFVPGWGKGFAGVWDREDPTEPVMQVRRRKEADFEAIIWAYGRMETLLAERKEVGADRWVARRRATPYDRDEDRSTMFLLTLEAADPDWPPVRAEDLDQAGFYLYQLNPHETDGVLSHIGFVHALEVDAKADAVRWGAVDEWIRVPDTVPTNLLATARWALDMSGPNAG